MIKPYDSGKNNLIESCQKIEIDEIIRRVNKEVKYHILQSHIEATGFKLNLVTSETRFNGKRYWFSCPICNNRVGTIYKHPVSNQVGCRNCLNLVYKTRRYKGMIESNT